ncbi:MAG: sucrase ferredoxin [Candidatus Nanopelagicales bacterium]|nr:sucrase ferredoxin [Candidatus Nanopelagicales bacterium]
MTSCRAASAAVGEPMLGSALTESTLLIVEQPGPWGRDATFENRMARAPADSLRTFASDPTTRLLMARRGRDFATDGMRHWWRVDATPTAVSATCGLLPASDPLTPDSLAGNAPAAQILFICTNSKRDRCCAEVGRKLFRALCDAQVWQISHLKGHRFAPTALRLSDGIMLGRITPDTARDALEGRHLATSIVRGRIGRSAAEQVAEWDVMTSAGVPLADLSTRATPEGVIVSTSAQRWLVELREHRSTPRPPSCGSAAEAATFLTTERITELGPVPS